MSDRQSKNYDEATTVFLSSVAGRTRSKRRGTYYKTSAEAHRMSSSSQNVEATNASHGSCGISAQRKRNSSSCINKTGLDGVSAPHDCTRQNKKRKIQSKLTQRVCCCKNNLGNNGRDRDFKEIEIEKIGVADLKNKNAHAASKMELSTRQELHEGCSVASSWKNFNSMRKKPSAYLYRCFSTEDVRHGSDQGLFLQRGNKSVEKTCGVEFSTKKPQSMSKTGPSTRQGIHGYFAATSSKNVGCVNKNIYCGSFTPEDNAPHSNQGRQNPSSPILQKGNGNEDTDSEGIEIEVIEEAEFMNHKKHFMPKTGLSTMEELNEGYTVATHRNVANVSKRTDSAVCCESSCHNDVCHCPDQLWLQESFVQRGSDSDDLVPEEFEIEEIGEDEFRNQRTHSVSKMGPSMGQELTGDHSVASSSNNVGTASKNSSSDILYASYSPEDCETDVSPLLDKSSPLVNKGNNNEYTSSEEIIIERIDEAEFRSEISRSASKIGSSIKQGEDERRSAANSWKNAEDLKEVTFDNCCQSLSPENAGRDSDKGQTDKSISSAEKGNNNDHIHPEEIGIEKIDESEFRSKRSHFMSKIGSSTRQYLNGHFAASSGKNVNSMRKKTSSTEKVDENEKREVAAYSSSKSDEDWNRNLNGDINNRSVECSSSSSSYSHSENINGLVQDDEINSYTEGHDINLGIASRTRSKMKIIKKPTKVDNVSLDYDSDSSSSDNGFCNFDDEDFEMESSYNSDDILGSHVEAREVLKNMSLDVSAEKGEDCRKEGCPVEHASKCSNFSNNKKKETNCEQPTSERLEFSLRERQLSHDASSKRTKGEKACKTYKVHEENEEINRIVGNDVNAEEGLQERTGERDNKPKFTYTQKDCDDAEVVNGLHSKDPQQTDTSTQRNEVIPSHSTDDFNHIDIQQKFDSTSSDFHGHDKTEKTDVAGETKMPTEKKQVSIKHNDFCRMLADSVLGTGPMLETNECDEAAKEAPASQTQNTLPLKFRFDDVPKEMEKTEYEKEMECLFAELDFSWALEDLGSFCPEVDEENENAPAKESRHAQCAKGKHELVLQDDQGLICIYCHRVELGPKDILPEWVEKTYRESEKKGYFEPEQLLKFDGIHLRSSIDNFADFGDSSTGTVWSIKPGIRGSMYEHQQEGFEFLWKNLAGSINLHKLKSTDPDPGGVGGCIISHAPGTGKTRLTIVFIESYLKLFPDCRPMIIAPASMLLTWEEEFRKWNIEFPFLNLNNLEFLGNEKKTALGLLDGAKRRNKDTIRWVKIYSWNKGGSILGISYSLFEKLTGEKHLKEKTSEKKTEVIVDDKMKALRKIFLEKPGLVVLDEGHTPRNQRSNIWNVLLKLQTEKRVILSGTPFQNNFAELFNTLRIVRPAIADVLAQEKTFSEMIMSRRKSPGRKYKEQNYQSSLISEVVDRAVEKLKISMSPFVHVHKGTILKQSLPGLRDCVILLKPPALQKSLIERLEGSPSTFQFEHKVALISVHPYLFQHSDLTEEQRIGIDLGAVEASKLNPNEGIKTKFILEFVRLSTAMNEKVLIFSQYILPLELIKEQLKNIFKWVEGKQILQMQGKLDQKQRQILINVFNDPQSESKIMLASTRCCSEGISLVGASRVVLLDVVWNPSVERQAISRAYRIGQKKFVYTYHLMTSGTTEADKYCRQAEKERLSELVFSSSNESNKQTHPSMGIEDRILEEMVGHEKLKEMFEKIINQPKGADLIQTFGLTS